MKPHIIAVWNLIFIDVFKCVFYVQFKRQGPSMSSSALLWQKLIAWIQFWVCLPKTMFLWLVLGGEGPVVISAGGRGHPMGDHRPSCVETTRQTVHERGCIPGRNMSQEGLYIQYVSWSIHSHKNMYIGPVKERHLTYLNIWWHNSMRLRLFN